MEKPKPITTHSHVLVTDSRHLPSHLQLLGHSTTSGVFQTCYSIVYPPNITPFAIAWIGSTQLALLFGLNLPIRHLIDKGYFRSVFHSGSAILVLGVFSTSYCKAWWSLWLVQGLITGTGMGRLFCSAIATISAGSDAGSDEKQTTLTVCLAVASGSLGGIAYYLIARHFLSVDGFATAWRVMAGLALGTMLPPQWILCTHKSQKTTGRKDSSDLSWSTLPDPSTLSAAAGLFFAFLGLYLGFVYTGTYAHDVSGLSFAASTSLLVFMLATNLLGSLVMTFLSERCIGPLYTLILSFSLTAGVISFSIAPPPTRVSLTVIACGYGFAATGVQVYIASSRHRLRPEVTTMLEEKCASPMQSAGT